MSADQGLDRLVDLAGIEPFYWDINGNRQETSEESKRSLLSALGLAAEDGAAVEASLASVEEELWGRSLPPVLVVREGEVPRLPVVLPAGAANDIEWTIVEDGGRCRKGQSRAADSALEMARRVGDRMMERRSLELPPSLGLGYHELRLSDRDDGATMPLIVAPARCHMPPSGSRGGRRWGIAAHLYTLRSRHNWGMGDLTDLGRLLEEAAELGASNVGINPLHALVPDDPRRASPYAPSSRLYLNPLYLDVTAIPDFAECPQARDLVASADFTAGLAAARADALVDYTAVAALKGRVLDILYDWFRRTHLARGSKRAAAFRRFQAAGAERLRRFAAFQALSETFGHHRWAEWPAAYRAPATEEMARIERQQGDRMEFHQYLQWQTEHQLTAARDRAETAGMAIGIYRDLAVSAAPDGADVWAEPEIFVAGCRVGAPPDPFNSEGQDWGSLPLHPRALRRSGYDYFIALLRANMRHAGALRIDHVMGLNRMFWVPAGASPASGAYVRYPFEDLLGVLALESHRHACLVVGEDLGTVPEGFRERMIEAHVLSHRVLYFEKEGERFKPPHEYPAAALACVSTHDLPTLKGFWEGNDLKLRERLGLYHSEAARRDEAEAREHDRRLLLGALAAEGLLPPGADPDHPEDTAMTPELMVATHLYLARSPAFLCMFQIDDLAGEREQLNLPGTVFERPNWRRRLSRHLEEITADPAVRALAAALREMRPDG